MNRTSIGQTQAQPGRAHIYAAAAGLVAATLLWPLTTSAQTRLRVGDSLPANHWFTENATRFWMQEVVRTTQNAVVFEHFPSEQLGKAKDMLSLTQSGVLDIGYVVPAYVQEKMPLTAVAELPGTFTTSCGGTLAYWKMAHGDGVLARREYQPNGVRVIYAIVMPPYQVFSGQRKIGALADLVGMKLRTTGGAQDALVVKLKGVPVRMAAPDMHESLSRGTVDGMIFPASSVLSYSLEGLVKSAITGENFGSAVLTFMMSESRWRQLPEPVRDAMAKAGDATTRRICAYADRELTVDMEKVRAKGAVTTPLSAEDRVRLAAASAAARAEWAEALDGRGKAGTEVLRAFAEASK